MKKIGLLAVLSASLFVIPTVRAVNFSDVQLWSGSGTNQAALVINWADGTSSKSLLWGYRWNGTATGEQMLYSVMAADPRLYAEVSGQTAYGTALFGLGYDLNNDHSFSVSPTLSFDNQHLAYGDYSSTDDSRIPASAGDLWQEGWNSGYWSYWLSTEDRLSADFSNWDYSGLGMTGRELTDGDWDGWSFAPGFNGTSPSMPSAVVPVPEPATPAIILLSGLLLVLFQRNRRSMAKACFIVSGLATLLMMRQANAASLDDIQLWTGTGTNRAAMVIHWTSPEVHNNSSVPNPAADKSLVWGYRWDGTNTAENMFNAIVANDHRLFVAASDPYPGFGPFIYAIGYDLNNNGVFGIRIGTNVFAENAFTNGLRIFTTEDADSAQSLDAGDLFWSGLYGANWEMWQEHGGAGGFTNAPDRGQNPYWTPTDTTYFSSGSHGQWDYTSGLELVTLHDGSWIGFTVSGGGLNFADENDPGSIAYDFHKHAPISPTPASTNSAYAAQIVASQGPFGASPYDDPTTILGAPSTRFYESASKPATRVKLVEPAYSTAPDRTNKLIVTLNNGSSIIARFNQPVYDNPANPYGIDFLVFGNAFYSGGGFSSDAANMNTFSLGTGGFYEPTKVSVSPGYTGQPGEDPANPATWPWYRYETGPYGDSDFPTQAYKWNRTNASWTDEVMDFNKPVNPAMRARFSAGGLTAADGIDLYDGSGGGTGFDLKESGFTAIQYVKVEGLTGYSAGEIDAVSIVRPMTVGDELTVSPANLTNNTAQLFFQKPGKSTQNVLSLTFTSVSDIAKIATSQLDNPSALSAINGSVMNAVQLGVSPVLGTSSVTYQADVTLSAGNYAGNGSNLQVLQWDGTNWTVKPFVFSSTDNAVVVQSVTNLSSFVVAQLIPPQLSIRPGTNGFVFSFTPMPNRSHTLERSTDFITWTPVTSFTPTNAQPMTLEDNAAPVGQAFYRLRLNP